MDFRVFVEPQQGASYEDQLAVALESERLGYDAFFRSDHYQAVGGDGLPGPTDSWVTLGALARETSTIRLGTLVNSVTFRYPGVTAIQVAQVDAMSHGRVELGMGAGWFESEHASYGIPFPAKRFGMLAEQLEIITGLWGTPLGETYSFEGEHYRISDSPALPKPVQRPVPVIVGGAGPRKTPELAARFAAEYNAGFPKWSELRAPVERVAAACEARGRDPETLVYSLARTISVGRTEAEAKARSGRRSRPWEDLKTNGLAGTVAEAVDLLGRVKEAGYDRVYLQLFDMHDLDQLALIAEEVLPQLA